MIFFCILLSGLFVACGQTPDGHDSSWNISGDAFSIVDTSQVIEGRHPRYLRGYMSMASMKPIIFVQNRLFEIPKPSKEIKISVNTRSENLGKAMLYAKTYNKAMTKILEDSADIRSGSWARKELRVPAQDAAFVAVLMKVEGDTARLDYDSKWIERITVNGNRVGIDDGDSVQRMWFDTLRVTVDGKSLYGSVPKGYKVRKKINKGKIIPAGMDDFSGLEKELKDKRIIGLGESIHGSKEFNRMAFDFIKNSVSRGECKLILLEMPLYLSVRWELFVQGFLTEEELDDIKREIALGSGFDDEDELAEFLQALREYNLLHEEKVHVLGMDTGLVGFPPSMKNSARDLIAAFINSGNKEKMLPILDFMDIERFPHRLTEIANKNETFSHKLLGKIMENEPFLRAEIGDSYFELAKSIISQFHNVGLGSPNNGPYALSLYDYLYFRRDYHMWLNTKMLVGNFSKEGTVTIIKAHNDHLSKSEMGSWFYDLPTLGYYLDREYGDKYAGIAMIAASGRRTGKEPKSTDNYEEELQDPLSGSIEKFCSGAGLDVFCYPAKDIPQDIRLIRSVGQGKGRKEFIYDNLTKNNDYILFLDRISPSREKRKKYTKEEIEEKMDFMLYGLREKRDSIFQQKMTYWKNR